MPDLVTNGDSDIISHTNMNMTLHQEKFSHKSTSVSGESITNHILNILEKGIVL